MKITRKIGNFKKFKDIFNGEVFEFEGTLYLQVEDGVVDLTNGYTYISLDDFYDQYYSGIENEDLRVFEAELIIK